MLDFPPLTGVQRADAAIVGGGLTGLLTGAFLARQGLHVTLLTQRDPLPWLPVYQSSLCPSQLQRIAAHHNAETLRSHLQRIQRITEALPAWLSPLAPYRAAECYAYARRLEELPLLESHLGLLQQLSIRADYAPDAGGCPFPVELSIHWPTLLIEAAALNNSLCHRILQAGGHIHADSRVLNASASQVYTAEGRIDAGCVLLCTGKPLGLASRRLLALLETHTLVSCCLDAPAPLHTIQQSVQDGGLGLLPGPGSAIALWDAGRTGTRVETERAACFQRILRRRMPDWHAGSLVFRPVTRSMDGLPIVGSLRAHRGYIHFASGAEDILTALVCAQALARLAMQHPAQEDLLLRPDRYIPARTLRRSRIRLRCHRAVSALRRNAPRCSHCACRLRYLAQAGWWGCAGCGSVYNLLGRRLSGPALQDAAISASQRPGW